MQDAAHECIREIGRLGCVQFTDLNEELTPFQRRYVSGVKRCDELERKVRFFNAEIDKFGLEVRTIGSAEQFLRSTEQVNSSAALLNDLERELEEAEKQLLEFNKFHDKLSQEYNEKIELHEVLAKSASFYSSVPTSSGPSSTATPLLDDDFGLIKDARDDAYEMRFSSVTGIVSDVDRSRFERALFRSTRGNCYVRFAEVDEALDNGSGEKVSKSVFIVFYKSVAIENKVKRICDAFGARRYDVPSGGDGGRGVSLAIEENKRNIADSRTVLMKNRDVRYGLCKQLSGRVTEWLWIILREKAVFHTLNTLKPDVSGMLRGEGWVVSDCVDPVKSLVQEAHLRSGLGNACVVDRHQTKPWPTPPTFFKTNSFTKPYQDFVDTYGVPRYKEANPALFTAVTFPFLFGMMYGDVGHGTCLALAGLYLCLSYQDDPKRGEMLQGVYEARYMLLMMGCFAVYAGVIYNDIFSLPMSLFKSQWDWGEDPQEDQLANNTCSYGESHCVYSMGIDPAWKISSNELLFSNSLKMKMAVIIGILQMNGGIFLKGMNAVYFKEKATLYFEVIPMMIFAYGLFGYMIIIIFVKWSVDWDKRMYTGTCNEDNGLWPECRDDPYKYDLSDLCKNGKDPLDLGGSSGGCAAPNLITTLINIALSPGSVDEPIFEGQDKLQVAILLIAFGSIPVLLLAKPFVGNSFESKHGEASHGDDSKALVNGDDEGGGGGHHDGEHEEEHDFTEVLIHQAIETIEFVLGMVSNTASYLRLWALSLAHTELAAVFWEKAMLVTIKMNNPFFIFVGYAVFAAVTFAVLMAMDVLECFLHALRLHWVEFQNKFYKADGYAFKPFALVPLLRAAA
jgi:V-type H+-transporting ATPase subunit a